MSFLRALLARAFHPLRRTPAGSASANFARGTLALGLDLWRRLPASGNLVLSPTSVGTGLAMAWAGARGETGAEMQKVLGFEGTPAEVAKEAGRLSAAWTDPARPYLLNLANRLFGQTSERFEAPFLEGLASSFGAALEAMDFRQRPEESRSQINRWVEGETGKRIANLLPAGSVSRDTRLLLVNATYLLARWHEPFAAGFTRSVPFRLSARKSKDVPTMHRTGSFRYSRAWGLQALELLYERGYLSMLVLLPSRVEGLAALEKRLTVDRLDRIERTLRSRQVAVALPRFEVAPAQSLALAQALSALGLRTAFDRVRADFTGMADPTTPEDRLWISEVFHRAFVKTDEQGTEAAAASAVQGMPLSALRARSVAFRADHPFLFLIRDQASKAVLFMGRVADPSVR